MADENPVNDLVDLKFFVIRIATNKKGWMITILTGQLFPRIIRIFRNIVVGDQKTIKTEIIQ